MAGGCWSRTFLARHRHHHLARLRRLRAGRVVAVPLGIAMGAWKPVEAFLEPFVSFARYLPASAFIPLLILWAGIGETAKAAGHLHRLGVPDHPDGRRQGRQHAARPGRGGLYAGLDRQRHRPARDHAGQCARNRRDPAPRARLGLDLCHRRRADRLVLGHRLHDHQQPVAAGDRTDHLRHHRHRPDRAVVRFRCSRRSTAGSFPGAWREQASHRGRVAHLCRRARRAAGQGADADRPGGRRQRLHHHPGAVRLRQVDPAAHRRRARGAERRPVLLDGKAVTGPGPTAAWCSSPTRCSPG